MPLLNRARGLAMAGVVSLAVVLPTAPIAGVAHAASVPAVQGAGIRGGEPAATTRRQSSRAKTFSARSSKVMRKARSLRGVPYRYGGSTPRGFDCSGYTSYVFKRAAGVKLPRRASHQARYAKRISRGKARPGDLVFFRRGGRVYHVGIYAGGNRTLHSPRPGKRVQTSRIWTRNVTFGRVL